jgi:hypothetical protein
MHTDIILILTKEALYEHEDWKYFGCCVQSSYKLDNKTEDIRIYIWSWQRMSHQPLRTESISDTFTVRFCTLHPLISLLSLFL